MSLFTELKRRNVFRIGIAYSITTWLIAQIAGLAAVSFFAPDWVMKMIITLLILGFPIALLMAWAYELTPDGLRRDADIEPGQSVAQANASKLDRTITIVLIMAVVYFSYDKFVLGPQRDLVLLESATQQAEELIPAAVDIEQVQADELPSIAVLAFANMSDDAGNEYFSEGLSEELLNLLVQIPQLRVIARTSSFSYKGKDTKIAQIGEELNVAHVLEGSVRKSGNRVRITVQLIKADNEFHLWSQTYDRTLDDIFAIQDEIATAVVEALKVSLLGPIFAEKTTDPKVYALYLQGRYLLNQRGEKNLETAISYFKQALEINPEYAPAWVDISSSYHYQIRNRVLSREKGYALAMEAVERALAINSEFASAWAQLAYLKKTYDWDWKGASSAIDKALELDPRNAQVIGVAASLAGNLGQTTVTLRLHEQSVAMDPLNLVGLSALGQDYVRNGRLDEAIEMFNRIVNLNPEYTPAYAHMGRAYLLKGDIDRALIEFNKNPAWTLNILDRARVQFARGNVQAGQALVDEYLATSSHDYPHATASVYALRGDNDTAFEWLELAYQQRARSLTYILTDSYLMNLTSDPRYPVFLEKLGLLEAWKVMPPLTKLVDPLSAIGFDPPFITIEFIYWFPDVGATEDNVWRPVTFGNGLFVAVAETGTHRVMTSPGE